tara:strand:- start:1331 stop:4264 length:2934 start_codon:yes stop_codon:yes gene_type:complete
MVTEQLIVNGLDIPLIKGIGTVLTYSIKDIEQPDKRKASFSKTIKLPNSKVTSDLFNFIFEINSDSTFNPNLKADAIYLINDIAVFKGIIQLKKVNKLDNEHYTYDVVLLGELANIFTEFGDDYVDALDMNWGDFDHDYDATQISNSWDTSYIKNGIVTPFQVGDGYVYPMVNYGWDGDKDTYSISGVPDFKPAAYAKEYIDRMFESVDFEYDSNFFNSTYFRSLIIPFNGKQFGRPNLDYANNIATANTPYFATTGTASNPSPSINDVLEFQTIVSNPNSQYNTTTGEFTVGAGNTGNYFLGAELFFTVTLNSTAPNTADMISTFELDVTVLINGVMADNAKAWVKKDTALAIGDYTTAATPNVATDTDYKNQLIDLTDLPNSVYTTNVVPRNKLRVTTWQPIYPTDVVTFVLKGNFISDTGETLNFEDTVTGTKYAGTATINLLSNSNVDHHLGTSQYTGAVPISFQTAIPQKVKKRDFFKAIIEMFNLYIEPDTDNPKKLIIEPREEFYNSTVADWSSKLDVSKEIKYEMLASKNKSRYNYSYKKDSDYYNKLYEETWLRTYGNREIDIINDFNSSEYSQKIMFSPTPSVGTVAHDRVVPTIIGVDKDLQPTNIGGNIRILYYGGVLSTNVDWRMIEFNAWTGFTSTYFSSYPYAGMWDNPFNPTEDIGFGLPREIYWDATFNTITVTNSNLYNKYHKAENEEQTDKDSKLVTAWFLLSPSDIYNLDFKVQYFFDNAYFRLQEVKYKPNSYEVSECKFLKLKTGAPFVITQKPIIGGYNDAIGVDETVPVSYTKTSQYSDGNILLSKSSNVIGVGNYISATAEKVDITGDNNKVNTKSSNINIQGDNNIIESNLKNVSLINTNNVTVTESNVTYINGQKRGGDGILLLTSGSYTQDLSIAGYEADCTSGLLTIDLLDGLYEGYEQTFKKVAGDFDLVITSRLILGQVESDSSIRITKINDSVTLYYNGVDYNIK